MSLASENGDRSEGSDNGSFLSDKCIPGHYLRIILSRQKHASQEKEWNYCELLKQVLDFQMQKREINIKRMTNGFSVVPISTRWTVVENTDISQYLLNFFKPGAHHPTILTILALSYWIQYTLSYILNVYIYYNIYYI